MKIGRTGLLLLAILGVALAVRLYGIGFGLPALLDPDEPLFVVSALKLLKDQTLNPGWFGHPGTTTIYALSLIDILVFGLGHLTGRLPDTAAFAAAIYHDPSIVVLPGRTFVALCGVGCVYLCFLIGRRLYDDRVGLLAAALLAINPLHISWSQVIRTDVQATVFMLLCVLSSIAIARQGRLRDYLLAGIWVGLGTATKWPAATIIACVAGAALLRLRDHPGDRPQTIARLAIAAAAAVATLLIVSPYLLIDHATVLANLGREARPQHLGATGGGLIANLGWYLSEPMRASLGLSGLVFALAGLMLSLRNAIARCVLLPGFLLFLLAISSESLIWARWIVPLLPFLCLFAALAIRDAGAWMGRVGLLSGWAAQAMILGLIATPLALTVEANAAERRNDTRTLAADWARRHIPADAHIAIEHLAFDMLGAKRGWTFLFPAGEYGCINGNQALAGQVRFGDTERWRKGRSILDLGTINRDRMDTCRADYAIVSHLDRYQREASLYPREIATYRALLGQGQVVASFRPRTGHIGGPAVQIVRLDKAR
ncbi:hypothetical protein ACFB49_27760 [Sphingomonas sp. DBB INV C78]|uniref:ArnT family glycosyltransferase n=1 Tax=Sphingomonas sp. DBB INV C78 TaxID=3349434 RepID=UPI0036D345FC